MNTLVKILHLEDNPKDTALVQATLESAGLAIEILRVETRDDFVAALEQREIDVIFADKTLPAFDGFRALEFARQLRPEAPFIFVSGTLGEEVAIESLKNGATDYVVKSRLARLAPVTLRALREVAEQRERQKAQAQIRANDARFRALIEHSAEAIVLLDAQGIVAYVSPSVTRILGGDADAWLGGNWLNRVHPDDLNLVSNLFTELLNAPGTSKTAEFHYQHSDGSWLWLEVTGTNLLHEPSVQAIVGNVRDITARKTSQEKLVHSENRFRALIENSFDAIVLFGADGTVLAGIPSTTQLAGYSLTEVIGRNMSEFIHPDDRNSVGLQMAECLAQAGASVHVSGRILDKNGAWRWMEGIFTNLLHEPSVQAIVNNYRDITERKRAEQALQESEQRFRLFFAASPDAILLVDPHSSWSIVDCNQAACQMNGYTREELIGQSVDLLNVNSPIDGEHDDYLEYVRQNGIVHVEAVHRHKDGHLFPIEVSTTLITVGGRELLLGIDRDVTERKRSEENTKRRAEEFAALYETANNIAQQTELKAVLQTAVERATRLLNASGGGLYLYENATKEMQVVVQTQAALPVGTRIPLGKGLAGRVAESHQAVVVNDYPAWEHRLLDLPDFGLSASVVVPMLYRGNFVGALAVNHVNGERKFLEADVSLLSLFASYAASAIHNAGLLEETRVQLNQLTAVYDAGLALNSVLEPRKQLEFLFQIALRGLRGHRAEFFRYNPSRNELRFELGLGQSAQKLAWLNRYVVQAHDENEIAGYVSKTRLPLYVPELDREPRWHKESADGVQSGLWVAVEHKGALLGVLGVLSEIPDAFSLMEERMLALFANQAAVALENARLFEQTRQQLERFAALRAVDSAISGSHDLRVMLDIIVEQVLNQLRVDAVAIFKFNPYLQMLEFADGGGFKTNHIERARLHIREGLAGRVAWERKTLHVQNLASIENFEAEAWGAAENFVGYCGAPLIVKGQVKGVLQVLHRAPLEASPEWLDFFETITGQAAIAMDNAELFENLQRSNMELRLAYETTIEGWSRALDLRDKETDGHTQRVTELTLRLARAMSVEDQELVHLRRGALLHDIGKMGIPDHILLQPEPLAESEWQIMSQHPIFALELLAPIQYLRPALAIPYAHHEKWDGTGYPRKLAGEQIPLAARIFAVVDVWDALTSDRPYRAAWDKAKARAYIREQSGKHFDPRVVETFLNLPDLV